MPRECGELPDPHAIRWIEIQPLPLSDIERGVPRIEVAHRVGAVFVWCVTVGDHELARERFARLGLPRLRETDEERPIGIDGRIPRARYASYAAGRPATSAMFSPRVSLPVDVQIGKRHVGVVLRDQLVAPRP